MTCLSDNAQVRALVDQWRDAAEFFKGDAGSDTRETLRACARELEAALAQQLAPSAPVGVEDIEALKRLRAALPDVGMNGWRFWAEVLDRVIAALAQQPAAECPDCLNDGCFCPSCNPEQPAACDMGVLTPTGTFCSVCEAPQHNTPSGVSCPNGHGGAAAQQQQGGRGDG